MILWGINQRPRDRTNYKRHEKLEKGVQKTTGSRSCDWFDILPHQGQEHLTVNSLREQEKCYLHHPKASNFQSESMA